jgi:chaperone LolA
MKNLWRATALIAGLAAAQASGITPDEIMKNVEHRLADQKTVKAQFEEVYVWKLTGEKQTVKGEFLLKGDDRFRITTDDQIVVSDGKTIWTFNKPSNRVLIDNVETAGSEWLPQKILLKTRKEYRHRLTGEETVGGRPCYALELTSETGDAFIQKMKICVDKETWIPQKIEQMEIGQNRRTYLLSDIQTGAVMDDALFKLKIPEGAEVIDLQ